MPFSVWLRYSLSHPCIMRVLAHAQIGLKTRFAHFTRSTRFRDRFEQESRTLIIHVCIVDLESFSKWTRTCLLCYKSGKKVRTTPSFDNLLLCNRIQTSQTDLDTTDFPIGHLSNAKIYASLAQRTFRPIWAWSRTLIIHVSIYSRIDSE